MSWIFLFGLSVLENWSLACRSGRAIGKYGELYQHKNIIGSREGLAKIESSVNMPLLHETQGCHGRAAGGHQHRAGSSVVGTESRSLNTPVGQTMNLTA